MTDFASFLAGKILPDEDVIPFFCRILKFEFEDSDPVMASCECLTYLPHPIANQSPASATTTQIAPLSSASASIHAHKYASHSDPAIADSPVSRIFAFSRPLENRARLLLAYRNQHSQLEFYDLDAIELPDVSTSFVTPGDVYDTFIPHFQDQSMSVLGRTSEHPSTTRFGERAAPRREDIQFPPRIDVASHRDLLFTLIKSWNGGAPEPEVEIPEHIQVLECHAVAKVVADRGSDGAVAPADPDSRKLRRGHCCAEIS